MSRQVGRIGGHLLKDQLVRDGTDLAFKNTQFDSTPVLQLDVNGSKIGVKTDAPLYDLDIRTDLKTTNFEATSIAEIDNIRMLAPNTVSTKIGPLYLKPQAAGAYFFMNRMQSDDLDFNDNSISGLTSNQSIELRPAGSGTLEIQSNFTVRGTLGVSNNITLDGNVNLKGNITFGDQEVDTIAFRPQFEQNLEPGTDDTLNLGSASKRWTTLFTPDLTQVDNVNPGAIKVSDQTWVDGVGMKIQGLQSDDDIIISTTENFGEVVSNPNGNDNEDEFGFRIAGNETYLVVTAPSEDGSTYSNEGKVYIFDWDYTLIRTISNPVPANNDRFGSAVDIAPDNSYIAIGAWQEGLDEGVVYIFNPSTGILQHTIQNPDSDNTDATDNFGKAIKADNDYLYVGADSANQAGVYLQEGAVYVYNPSTGSQVQYIPNPSSSADSQFFGRAIATNNTHLFVSEDYISGSNEGRIRAYLKSTWAVDYDISDPIADGTGDFGLFISANNNYVVTAHNNNDKGYIFDASNGALLHTLDITDIIGNINGGPIIAGDFAVFPHDAGMTTYRMSSGNAVTDYILAGSQKYLYPIENGNRFILSSYANNYNVQIWKTTKFALDIEDVHIRENYFENQLNTPLQFRNTGIGYVKFDGTNAMIIPYGSNAQRPTTPELGDTRWNSDEEYLESFGGEVENVSLSSATLTGIPDQVVFVTTTTNNNGIGLEFQLNIVGETIVSTSITEPGAGYLQGDVITISGNQISGGTTPTNDIVYTVGAQTNDGYIIATGGGEEVTEDIMDDLGVIYSLILA